MLVNEAQPWAEVEMCDIMPTISEDEFGRRRSSGSSNESNYDQLVENLLDEKEKLVEALHRTQDDLASMHVNLQEIKQERDELHRQLFDNGPQVREELQLSMAMQR